MNLNFEVERGEVYRLLRNWLKLNTNLDSPAVIYALAECIQERLDICDITDSEKGGIVSDLIKALGEVNKEELAINRQIKQFMLDGKRATLQ